MPNDFRHVLLTNSSHCEFNYKMTKFIQFCNHISQLDTDASEDLSKVFNARIFRKGDYLLRADEICKHIYFIEEGLTKLYFNKGDKEFIMTFFRENMMFTELNGYLTNGYSKYMVLALETTTVQFARQEEIEKLSKSYHCIETLFRRQFSMAALNIMKRITEMLEENATTRYNNFLKDNNSLLQRISLGDLANYLGITQVSLSRIQASL